MSVEPFFFGILVFDFAVFMIESDLKYVDIPPPFVFEELSHCPVFCLIQDLKAFGILCFNTFFFSFRRLMVVGQSPPFSTVLS